MQETDIERSISEILLTYETSSQSALSKVLSTIKLCRYPQFNNPIKLCTWTFLLSLILNCIPNSIFQILSALLEINNEFCSTLIRKLSDTHRNIAHKIRPEASLEAVECFNLLQKKSSLIHDKYIPIHNIEAITTSLHKTHGDKNFNVMFVDEWSLGNLNKVSSHNISLVLFPKIETLLHSLHIKEWSRLLLNGGINILVISHPIELQKGFYERTDRLLQINPTFMFPTFGSFWTGTAAETEPILNTIKFTSEGITYSENISHIPMEKESFLLPADKSVEWAMGMYQKAIEDISLGKESFYPHDHLVIPFILPKHEIQFKSTKNKLLIHITPYIVDHNESISNIVKDLVLESTGGFETKVMITESMSKRTINHLSPYASDHCISAQSLGKNSLKEFLKKDIEYVINGSEVLNDGVLLKLANWISNSSPIGIVFHGIDPCNIALAKLLKQYRPILISEYILYDDLFYAKLSTVPLNLYNKGIFHIPPCPRNRDNWNITTICKPMLGNFLNDDFIIVTYSDNLDLCLSQEFCNAISLALHRCEKMALLIVGHNYSESIIERFPDEISNRIHFLKKKISFSNITRACDVYLDPFPAHSKWEILTALASGCPIVSMSCKETGMGSFFNDEELIANQNDISGYSSAIISLYENKKLYFEKSQRSYFRYEGKTNKKWFCAKVESIIKETLGLT